MTTQPSNSAGFRYHPVHAVVCLLPGRDDVDSVRIDLREQHPGLEVTRVLIGSTGVDTFDVDGTRHGWRGRLNRTMQQLGSVENVMLAFEHGLRAGEALITIGCDRDQALTVARLVDEHGAHAIVYFSHFGLEQFSPL